MPERQPAGLHADAITVRYGGAIANDAVTITARPGEVTGLIGPNGAGKTSFIDAITGFTRCTGEVAVGGRPLNGLVPHQRARLGLVRTWQAGDLFDDITVAQNLEVAVERFALTSPWRDIAGRRGDRVRAEREAVDSVLARLRLEHVRDRRPADLSLGERRLVGVARALVMSPRALLLDEPAAGLHSQESGQLGVTIGEIAASGVAVLLIEHDIDLVLAISAQVFVLDYGRLIAAGPPSRIRHDPAVIAAYLGEPSTAEATHDRRS